MRMRHFQVEIIIIIYILLTLVIFDKLINRDINKSAGVIKLPNKTNENHQLFDTRVKAESQKCYEKIFSKIF